jgi:hypothetical protein
VELDDVRLEPLDDLPQHGNVSQGDGLSGHGHQRADPIDLDTVYLTHAVEMALIEADHRHLMADRVVCDILTDILHPANVWIIILRDM